MSDEFARLIWCQFGNFRKHGAEAIDGGEEAGRGSLNRLEVWLDGLYASGVLILANSDASDAAKDAYAEVGPHAVAFSASLVKGQWEDVCAEFGNLDYALELAAREMPEKWAPDGSESQKP